LQVSWKVKFATDDKVVTSALHELNPSPLGYWHSRFIDIHPPYPSHLLFLKLFSNTGVAKISG
jgi:hypothetical protein